MRRYKIEVEGKPYTIDVQELKLDEFYVIVGDQHFDVRLVTDEDLAEAVITPGIAPAPSVAPATLIAPVPAARPVSVKPPAPESLPPVPAAPQPALPPKPQLPTDGARPNLTAPMPGTILSVSVQPGDQVTRGQTVMILEAMKGAARRTPSPLPSLGEGRGQGERRGHEQNP